ncbi:hypothetical protein V6N11_052346 [Hibiscus sabdariffa]|uniref:hAT-like transposase RNase-H fold domain-containing protein n=1 Tax=Hibiscus sabdariffa TaxID=183260 RepID=A0ABR2UAI3_9ROSI
MSYIGENSVSSTSPAYNSPQLPPKGISSSSYEANDGFQDVARKELVKMIIMHDYPLSIVDDEYFRNYCYSLQPMFDMPSRTTIRRDILNIYEEGKVKTMSELEANEGRIVITIDIWTVDHQNKEYMVVTVHYIDNSWTPHKRIIRVTLNEWIVNSNSIISGMAKRMLENFEKYWSDVNGIVGVATLLDPRYKTLLLEYYFEDIYGVAVESEVEKIVQLCRNLVKEYQEKMLSRESEAQSFSTTPLDRVAVDPGHLKDFDAYVSRKRQKKLKVISELDCYLEEDVFPRTWVVATAFLIWLVENADNKSSDMLNSMRELCTKRCRLQLGLSMSIPPLG